MYEELIIQNAFIPRLGELHEEISLKSQGLVWIFYGGTQFLWRASYRWWGPFQLRWD